MIKIKLQKGFTLLELLVVIAIIGLFSSIVFATVSSIRREGRNTYMNNAVGEYVKAAYLYQSTYGRFPSTGDQWLYCLAEDPVTCKHFHQIIHLALFSMPNFLNT